jgi:protein-ribulosamine 3-kinase
VVAGLEETLGVAVKSTRPIAGGDICRAYLVTLHDESKLFVKTRPGGPPEMFPTEGRGLEWLAETKTLRIPEVVAAEVGFLALEFLDSAPKKRGFDEELGQGMAALHQYPADLPGLDHDNFIGPLPQPNEACDTWPEFYAEQRLRPRVEEAIRSGKAPNSWLARFETLFRELPSVIPEEPNSRLHGDLWGGNLLVGPSGEPCLIDPAVYVGHREVDLAMMRLFGGFSQKVFDSYNEVYPLQDGYLQRVDLYQLYPLLVHVNLFGAGYVSSVERVLERYL